MVERKQLKPPQEKVVDILLDSGAFSAWKLKKEMPLEKYCDFLHEHAAWIWNYVAVDVIKPHNPEEAAEAGYKNFKYMRSRGLNPMPVFHAWEDIKWLFKYLDEGCDYVGISASSLPHHNDHAERFYDVVWSQLANINGLPIVRTHAFGEGRMKTLGAYPWYSGDSASWLYQAQRTGIFWVPGIDRPLAFRNELKRDGVVALDVREHALLDVEGEAHSEKEVREAVQKAGVDYDFCFDERHRGTRVSFMARTYLTCLHYLAEERQLQRLCPISHKPHNYVIPREVPDAPGILIDRIRVFLVLGGNSAALTAFAYAKGQNALVSYEHIRSFPGKYESLENYAFDPMWPLDNDKNIIPYHYDLLKVLGHGNSQKANELRRKDANWIEGDHDTTLADAAPFPKAERQARNQRRISVPATQSRPRRRLL